MVYLREKQPQQTQILLASLTSEYPENQLLRKELAKVAEQIGRGGAALR